jgi:glutamine transport system substrate-binding protein
VGKQLIGGMTLKKVTRFSILATLFVSVSIILFGCGSDTPKNGDSKKQKLIVGTNAMYAPMESMDKDGNIVGIDIDIVNAIADAVGIEVEFKNYGWDPLFPAVSEGLVDFAVSSITITPDREVGYDFTDPYFIANQLILVPDDSDVTSFEDLKDKRVSVQLGTTGDFVTRELLGKTSSKVVAMEEMPIAILEMINGNADAAVGDNAVIIEYQKNNPKVKLKIVEDASFEKEYYGIMVKKGNKEMVELLNEGIKIIKENGKLKEITGFDVE